MAKVKARKKVKAGAKKKAASRRQPESGYEITYKAREGFVERQRKGKIVLKGDERPWDMSRQGRLKWFLNPHLFSDTVLQDWFVFIHDVQTHSGKHIHQGGLALFVVEGQGYTVVDGVRHDWEKGDLILLPIRPGGVEHQHFNLHPGQGARWMAFIYLPHHNAVGSALVQKENAPLYHAHSH
jgi:hypothetical protein